MLPQETIAAAFPPRVPCGRARLHPLTAAHVAALEAVGIPHDGLTPGKAVMAAWVMSLPPERLADAANPCMEGDAERISAEMAEWARSHGVDSGKAYASAAETLRVAFTAFVPAANGGEADRRQLRPKGYGWPVEIAQSMMSRYSMGFAEAMATPLCTVFALLAAGNAAEGCGGGPDYYERMDIALLKRMRVEELRRELAEMDAADGGKGDGDGIG